MGDSVLGHRHNIHLHSMNIYIYLANVWLASTFNELDTVLGAGVTAVNTVGKFLSHGAYVLVRIDR